ncbi:MAG TPA: BACON domain-containing carbohydrate-binding protein [Vicinamibacterales bacterium]|nr:BACON domain-containing carbohydrate-binding protein [Vicinamibacterales bacterium]
MRACVAPCVGAVALVALAGCSHSPTSPSPVPPSAPHPSVAVTSIAVRGQSAASGFRYATTLKLRESTGVAATIVAVDLTFTANGAAVAGSHHDKPISDGTNVCPASGTIETRQLDTVDPNAAHAFATAVQAVVTFSDGTSFGGTATAAADVPPLPPPNPPQTFTLIGVITDVSTHAPIGGAKVEALNGLNAGQSASADASGSYKWTGLLADTFRVRASASGYDPGEQNVTIPTNPRADFELRRPVDSTCSYVGASNAPSIVGSDGGDFTIALTRTAGACAWQASADVSWMTFSHGAAGAGSGPLVFTVAANGLNTRSGTITVSWTGGSASFLIVQGPHPDWECFVALSKGPEDFDHVPSAGGTLTVSASVQSVPAGWQCTATVSGTVPWLSGGGSITSPTILTFTVAANPTPGSTRTGSITIQSGAKSASQAVTQR